MQSSSFFQRSITCFLRHRKRNHVVCNDYLSNAFATDAVDRISNPDPRFVNIQHAPEGFDVTSAVVYPEFITEEEGKSLIQEASKRLKRRRFEDGHWDSVITGYREVEMSTPEIDFLQGGIEDMNMDKNDACLPLFAKVIQKTRSHIAKMEGEGISSISNNIQWLPCHAIDLSADGKLTAHVDSIKFSGGIVSGVSLLSDSIMRLKPSSNEWHDDEKDDTNTNVGDTEGDQSVSKEYYVDLYLPRLSLYVLSGMSRYSYTHELLPSGSTFEFIDGKSSAKSNDEIIHDKLEVVRGRRLSIIFRDTHQN